MTVITALLAVALTLTQSAAPISISARARSIRPGEVIVLTIVPPATAGNIRVRAFDRSIPVYLDGEVWHAIVGIDLDVKPGLYRVSVDGGSGANAMHGSYELKVVTRVFRTRRLTVNEAFVTPPKSELPRIERDTALLAATWESSAPGRLWSAPFVRPVPHDANSAFGTRSVFNGKPRNSHGGADFLSPAGTPIKAPNAGRIAVARNLYFSGNTVIIDHGLGIFSMLAHLSRIDVQDGDVVTTGQVIGLVGATGRVTGPHLHWAVRAGNARVDPLSLLSVLGEHP